MVPPWTTRLYLRAACDHFGPFVEVDEGGLFHVDVLAGLAGFHGHVGVPVVRRADAYRVDGLVGEDLAEVLHGFRVGPILGADRCRAPLQGRLVDVAESRYVGLVGSVQRVTQIARSLRTYADEGQGDPVVGSAQAAGEEVGSQSGRARGLQKIAAVVWCFRFHLDSFDVIMADPGAVG